MSKKNKTEIYQPDDHFFKELMTDLASAKEFIQKFCPAIAQDLDLDTLQADNTSYINEQLKDFHSDIVYRCQFKNADEGLYFSFLMENKSRPDNGVVLQLGLYLFTFLYKLHNDSSKKLEPVLPIVFYNGKPDWTPKTVAQLFETHPFFEKFEPYLPSIEFNFLNITKVPLEELLSLQIRFLRAGLFSMANRHRVNIILENIALVLSDQPQHKIKILMHYIFAEVERSPEDIIKIFDQLDFTEKRTAMSVLEQIRKQGEENGIEKGVKIGEERAELVARKNSLLDKLKSLLSLLRRLPDWTNEEIADVIALDLEKIEQVRTLLASKSKPKITKSLIELFFQELPFEAADEKKLEQLIEKYLAKA